MSFGHVSVPLSFIFEIFMFFDFWELYLAILNMGYT
jgi:hypothetical protein